ncbi:hypothetical protein VHUM_03345 [Vanrija humicola]|uniref:protein disulfide-isomerase n=1 Tax=Vanrija humicola TaxID=5417 RepID=A0A7D8UX80_VANHU|nr:hypothetical protein VHUM_03345 [Vanrija humicola]
MRLFSLSAALLGLAGLASAASNVIDLDSKNFNSVGRGVTGVRGPSADWCGHCKTLAPIYEKLADAFPGGKVIIAKTDADGVGRELGNRFGIQGFPTLKWFPAGSLEPEDYNSGRDLDSLAKFVTEKSGVKSNIKPPPPPAAKELDASNFDDVVDGSKNVLVAFTAPWCGHCKNMKPAYEKVAKAFSSESNCLVAHVNADQPENKPLAARFDVKSFPTIKFFPKGAKEPIAYVSGRSEEAFTDFLNEHCGTFRSPSGLYNDFAGKIADFDVFAHEFMDEVPSREDIVKRTKEAVTEFVSTADDKAKTAAQYYYKAMERIVEKGDAWLEKEKTRLTNLLAKDSASSKLDELKVKVNILSSFVAKRVGEPISDDDDEAARDEL